MRRYRYATTLTFTDEAGNPDEVDVEVSYTVAWGSSGTPRPYYGPVELYDEGSPSEVEDLTLLSVDGVGGLFDQHDEAAILQAIVQNHTDAMLTEAREVETDRDHAAQEARWEERPMERFQ